MEIKSGEEKQSQYSKAKGAGPSWSSKGRNVCWDCGSTLYDLYELNSFKRQLDSAIANSPRTLSMPHLPERRLSSLQQQPSQQQPPQSSRINKSFKISRTFQKLLRFVFKTNNNKSGISSSRSSNNNSTNFHQVAEEKYPKDRFYVVYDKCDEPTVLSTIPELPDFEIGGLSPEITALVRKSASERFTANAIGISCA